MIVSKRRDELILQVKKEYANIMSHETQQHFHKTNTGITPKAYYKTLQDAVISEISHGTFDSCRDGVEIVNKVAADKSMLPGWI